MSLGAVAEDDESRELADLRRMIGSDDMLDHTVELATKVVAYGFLMHRHSYLRDPWCQDFVVVSLAWLPILISWRGANVNVIRPSALSAHCIKAAISQLGEGARCESGRAFSSQRKCHRKSPRAGRVAARKGEGRRGGAPGVIDKRAENLYVVAGISYCVLRARPLETRSVDDLYWCLMPCDLNLKMFRGCVGS